MSLSSYSRRRLLARVCSLAAIGLAVAAEPARAASPDFEVQAEAVARALPLWTGLPFAGVLLSIALFPLVAPRFWSRQYHSVAIGWALVFAAPFAVAYGSFGVWKVAESLLLDYLPFIILLWALYTISGGVFLRANLVATPALNAVFLVAGTLIASVMGTTGASMLLIRPMLRANSWRRRRVHVFVFFIFLVSNIGGVLTPLGDPPLFLGFLHGVPFFWTLRLLPHLLIAAGGVLAVFVALDWVLYRRELENRPSHHAPMRRTSFRIEGAHNFLLLAVVLGAVVLSGTWHPGDLSMFGIRTSYADLLRDAVIVLAGWLSIRTTPRQVRKENGFGWVPIKEVAYLFFGVFVTIIPVLMMLRAGINGSFAWLVERASGPLHYFWMAGSLSSVLDNAPTYLAFFNLALGKLSIGPGEVAGLLSGAAGSTLAASFAGYLEAISAGAVFMGAMTYLGNGPNLMVWSIAKDAGVKMPGFFGYILWSVVVLLPILALVAWTLMA